MKLLVINPITGEEWIEKDRKYFQGIADKGTKIKMVSIKKGPKSIETFYDVAYAQPDILRILQKSSDGVDAVMINCFADPGLKAARELTDKVVLGPAETSMCVATQLGSKFSVISTAANTAPWVEKQAREIGLISNLASGVSVNIPVLDLESNPERTTAELIEKANQAIREDGAEVIILGCTGMATMAQKVVEGIDVPLIEPAATTFKVAETLVKLGLRHYKGGLYLSPSPGKIEGYD